MPSEVAFITQLNSSWNAVTLECVCVGGGGGQHRIKKSFPLSFCFRLFEGEGELSFYCWTTRPPMYKKEAEFCSMLHCVFSFFLLPQSPETPRVMSGADLNGFFFFFHYDTKLKQRNGMFRLITVLTKNKEVTLWYSLFFDLLRRGYFGLVKIKFGKYFWTNGME